MKALDVAAMRTKPMGTVEKAGRGLRQFFGALMLFSGAYLVLSIPRLFPDLSGESQQFLLWGMAMTLIFGVLFSFPEKVGMFFARLTWKNDKDKGTEITWRFTENEFSVHTSMSDLCCQYAVIDRVVESPDHIFLFLDVKRAYIIRKDSFRLGNADMFGVWVAQKCGKELIRIK